MRNALGTALLAAALGGLIAPSALAQDLAGPPEPPPPPMMQPPPPGPPPGFDSPPPPPPMGQQMWGGPGGPPGSEWGGHHVHGPWCKHGMDGPPPPPPPPPQFDCRMVCMHEWSGHRGRHLKRRAHPSRHVARRVHKHARVEHYGYVTHESYKSVETVIPPPPPPCGPCKAHHAGPGPTTFDTGYITWPGKVRF